jgi:type IV secretory pathway VirB4 component
MSRKTTKRLNTTSMAAALAAVPGEAMAELAIRSSEVGSHVTTAAMLAGGTFALAGAVGLAAWPALRNVVLPPPPEAFLCDLLQFDAVLEDCNTIRCKDGALVQTIALEGMDYGAKTPDERNAAFVRRKAWFDSLTELPITVKILSTRERVAAGLDADYEQPVLSAIHEAWMGEFDRAYANNHYVVLTAPASLKAPLKVLTEAARATCDALHDYGPRMLELGDGRYSPLLSFWATQINGFRVVVGAFKDRLSERLVSSAVTFSTDTGLIEYQDGPRRLHQAVVSVKTWGESSDDRLLARLLALDGTLTALQFVRGVSKGQAMAELRHRARQAMIAFQNKFTRDEFETATELVDGGREGLMKHSFVLFLSGESPEDVERMVTEVRRVFSEFGVRPAIETTAAEWLWRCRLPGFDEFVRLGSLLGANLAQLVSFEDEPRGQAHCGWGNGPLRLFKTVGGAAYALQLHVSEDPEALAHSLTIAPAGSGKTTLFQHLIGGALRHSKLRAYIFDRFSGTRIFTTTAGGRYLDLVTGAAADVDGNTVALNPLQCADTPENRAHLHIWLRQLAGVDDDAAYAVATRAVEAIFGVRRLDRSLSTVYESAFDHGSDMKKGLAKWVGAGPQANWFNGARDSLDLSETRLVAFEMSDVFKDPGAAASMVSYIMHRIRSVVRENALPHLVFFDEAAPMLEDEFFRKNVQVLLREHRKLNGSINLVFQDAGAVHATGIAETIINQCQTVFLFPNDKARRDDYAHFDLTESQWDFIKGTARLSRFLRHSCLVKRGKEAVILDLDLRGLGPWLKVYRSGAEPVRLMRELQQKWGTDKWLAQYLELA